MKNLILAILATLICTTSIFAQKDETLFNRSGVRFTGIWGGPTLSISKIEGENAYFRGGSFGLEFNKSILLGWGGMELESDIRFEDVRNAAIDMNYKGFIAGYAPSAYKAFHPKFTVLVGPGNLNVEGESTDKILVVQPSLGLEVNVFRWFRVGLNGGYRIVTDTNVTGISNGDLTTPYGEIKFKFGWSWGR